tara:strand:+ start:914 stop:1024 length:111 start_codon:yes stop_codon:yes gene_type:complete
MTRGSNELQTSKWAIVLPYRREGERERERKREREGE